ncbi:MAG: hypothetical protein M0P70_10240 [Desulfobulbaceae bacterium]|nr:hypothetical protein [Desulfobulbaceae bacterium]
MLYVDVGFAELGRGPAQTPTFVGKVTKMKKGDNFVGVPWENKNILDDVRIILSECSQKGEYALEHCADSGYLLKRLFFHIKFEQQISRMIEDISCPPLP